MVAVPAKAALTQEALAQSALGPGWGESGSAAVALLAVERHAVEGRAAGAAPGNGPTGSCPNLGLQSSPVSFCRQKAPSSRVE